MLRAAVATSFLGLSCVSPNDPLPEPSFGDAYSLVAVGEWKYDLVELCGLPDDLEDPYLYSFIPESDPSVVRFFVGRRFVIEIDRRTGRHECLISGALPRPAV